MPGSSLDDDTIIENDRIIGEIIQEVINKEIILMVVVSLKDGAKEIISSASDRWMQD
jgi:hypothetical protein